MRAIRLRTEYLENPMGIDITGPRFFWNCEGDGKQGAWQIVATDDRGEAVWDSGKVAGDKMDPVSAAHDLLSHFTYPAPGH